MKKVLGSILAAFMIFSVVAVAEVTTANAQVTVKKKSSGGVIGYSKRGVKYVYRNGKRVAVYTGKKVYQGGKYVGKKGYQGTKYVGKKGYQGGKYVGKKTVNGTKYVGRKTKKIFTGN